MSLDLSGSLRRELASSPSFPKITKQTMQSFHAWMFLVNMFDARQPVDANVLRMKFAMLAESNMCGLFVDWVFGALRENMCTLMEMFWGKFREFRVLESTLTKSAFQTWVCNSFDGAIELAHCSTQELLKRLSFLKYSKVPALLDRFYRLLHTVFFHNPPLPFRDLLVHYFTADPGAKFARTCEHIRSLRWMHEAEGVYSELLFSRIEKRILRDCKGQYEEELLDDITAWVESEILPWLKLVIGQTEDFNQWKSRLLFFTHERFAELRTSEMFDIVLDFPESMCAVLDLKKCLLHTNQSKKVLIVALREVFDRRLLHPGANTSDIITQYISLIRTLRVLDPSGVVLEVVGEGMRKYLSLRSDAVRCVVTNLTEELLAEEEVVSESENEEGEWMPDPREADPSKSARSRKGDIIGILVGIFNNKDQVIHEYRAFLADKLLKKNSYDTEAEVTHLELLKLRFGETSLHYCEVMLRDIINSKRVNGSIRELDRKDSNNDNKQNKTPFVKSKIQKATTDGEEESDNEKRHSSLFSPSSPPLSSLSSPFVSSPSSPPLSRIMKGTKNPPKKPSPKTAHKQHKQETKTIEDGKEEKQQSCSSSSASSASALEAPSLQVVSALMLSKEFWPSLSEETFTLPSHLHGMLEQYGKYYNQLKAPRVIEWQANLGSVDLELSLEDRELSFNSVSPIQATIIWHFQTKPVWTLQALATELEVEPAVIRRWINFWVNQAVLREIGYENKVEYELIETLTAEDAALAHSGRVSKVDDLGGVSAERQGQADQNTIAQYILGMLQSGSSSLSLQRIHAMLQMFNSPEFTYRSSPAELKAKLDKMIEAGKLTFEDGLYKKRAV